MRLGELLVKYLDNEVTANEVIRMLSGAFNPDEAVNILAVVNVITRHEDGDLDTETFKKMFDIEHVVKN